MPGKHRNALNHQPCTDSLPPKSPHEPGQVFLAAGASIEEQILHMNAQRFRQGLVFKAYKFVCHSTLGLSVIMKKTKKHHDPTP